MYCSCCVIYPVTTLLLLISVSSQPVSLLFGCETGVASKLLMRTLTTVDNDMSATDDSDMKARRIHNVLERIRSQGLQDVGNDRRSVLDELHSFANTLNGLELPPAPATLSDQDRHQQTYSDRLAQTRGDMKLLEQLVSQTFHLPPQQSSAVHDSTPFRLIDQQPVILHSLLFYCYCHILRVQPSRSYVFPNRSPPPLLRQKKALV